MITDLSPKQKEIFKFFTSDSDMLFEDGSVRAGKTMPTVFAYLMWATSFKNHSFGIGGRTIGTLKRNIVYPYVVPLQNDSTVKKMGGIAFHWSENRFTFAGNSFHLFGGDKETSQFLIQGKTLAGMMFDEVATMLISFVNQALARCSVPGAKIVFTCNPSHPKHFFKTDFIDRAEVLNAQRLHFTMDDNPSLSDKVKERYKNMYTGVFYERYILGRWVAAEGVIFLQFASNPSRWIIDKPSDHYDRLFVGVDFGGNKSKTVFVLAGVLNGTNGRPEIHIIDSHIVKNRGEGVDSVQIRSEYTSFFKRAVDTFKIQPHVTNVDHLEMLRLDLKKSVAAYDHRVVMVDKSALSLSEWVKAISSLFNLDMIKIVKNNIGVIDALSGLVFDDKADDDRPLDDGVTCDVDTYDSLRYSIVDIMKDWTRRGLIDVREAA